MGCCGSVYYANIYTSREDLVKYQEVFEALQLNEGDVGSMYKIFRKIDLDGSGTIEIGEMLAFLDVDRTKFSKRLFSIFDDDASGEIDFREFVLSCWNYCSLCRTSLIVFAFDLYDRDNSGVIDTAEVIQMTKDVYGKKIDTNPYTKGILQRLNQMEDPELTIPDFKDFVKNYQALLFPAYLIQEKIQRKVMGEEFWRHLAQRRLEITNGSYMSIADLLSKHTSKTTQTTSEAGELIIGMSGTIASRQSKDDSSNMKGFGSLDVTPKYSLTTLPSDGTPPVNNGRKSSVLMDSITVPGPAGRRKSVTKVAPNAEALDNHHYKNGDRNGDKDHKDHKVGTKKSASKWKSAAAKVKQTNAVLKQMKPKPV